MSKLFKEDVCDRECNRIYVYLVECACVDKYMGVHFDAGAFACIFSYFYILKIMRMLLIDPGGEKKNIVHEFLYI